MRLPALCLQVVLILAAAAALAGCGTLIKTPPPPVPTLVLDAQTEEAGAGGAATLTPGDKTPSGVTASGVVKPGDQASLTTASGGRVAEVLVDDGDTVEAGQVLLRLSGSEKLAAVVETARYELLSAEQAQQALNRNAALERANAQLRLAQALQALDDAERVRNYRNYRNGSDSSIESARADFILASDAFEHAQSNYNAVSGNDEEDVSRAGALSALAAARKARDRALANLNYLLAMPDELDVGEAEAELQAALAETASAKEEYERLKDGPDPDEWALSEARIQNAHAQLAAAEAALADLEISAPFSGTLAEVNIHAGEWATAGQPLLSLLDLSHMRVETSDLSERDVPRVAVGQAAEVYIEPLGLSIAGRVVEIAPLAESLGGDVVYTTTVELDEIPEGLRAGMSVEVTFDLK